MPSLRDAAKQAIQTIDAEGIQTLAFAAARAALVEALGEDPATDEKPTPDPFALIFPSRSGGKGHVVIVTAATPSMLACTCPAFLSVISARHAEDIPPPALRGCWAMIRARHLLGLPEPG